MEKLEALKQQVHSEAAASRDAPLPLQEEEEDDDEAFTSMRTAALLELEESLRAAPDSVELALDSVGDAVVAADAIGARLHSLTVEASGQVRQEAFAPYSDQDKPQRLLKKMMAGAAAATGSGS